MVILDEEMNRHCSQRKIADQLELPREAVDAVVTELMFGDWGEIDISDPTDVARVTETCGQSPEIDSQVFRRLNSIAGEDDEVANA